MRNAKILVRSLLGATVLSLFLGLSSCKQENKAEDPKEVAEDENEVKFDENDAREDDAEFLVDAAENDMMEVELGKLAQSKATNTQVRKFAEMMVAEHSKSANEMKPVAERLKVTLPASLTETGLEKQKTLNEKTGNDFDKKYMDIMVEAHDDAVENFEKYAEKANDAELRSWAAGKLPGLKSHLEQAKQLKDQLK